MSAKYALVPVEATKEQTDNGMAVKSTGQFIPGFSAQEPIDYCEQYWGRDTLNARYKAVLAAAPCADLLARIVCTLNDASIDLWAKGMNTTARKVDAILDELGG